MTTSRIIRIVISDYIRKAKFALKKGMAAKYYVYDEKTDTFKPDLPKRKLVGHDIPIVTKLGNINRIARENNKGKASIKDVDSINFKIEKVVGGKIVPVEKRHTKKWKSAKWMLVRRVPEQVVLSNPTKAGKVKEKIINGQDLLSGNVREFEKEAILTQIGDQLIDELNKQQIAPVPEYWYPITITIDLYDNLENQLNKNMTNWDVFNRLLPFMKKYPDVLVERGIIYDDSVEYVSNSIGGMFYPIGKEETRRLVLTIKSTQ